MSDSALPRVRHVEVIADHVLRVVFHDGAVRDVELKDELWGPMAEPLKDPAYFALARVDAQLGTVCWPNGYDLDPDVLHGDHAPAQRPPVSAQAADASLRSG
jgi:hypothetical protein